VFQHSFVIGGDSNRSITNMAVSGTGVWLSLQNSAVLRLVHSVTYEVLAEINTAPAVTKMLSSKSSDTCTRLLYVDRVHSCDNLTVVNSSWIQSPFVTGNSPRFNIY
jgi:hypothetical protein